MRNADCDSPVAITVFRRRSASGFGPDGCRMASPACEKMS